MYVHMHRGTTAHMDTLINTEHRGVIILVNRSCWNLQFTSFLEENLITYVSMQAMDILFDHCLQLFYCLMQDVLSTELCLLYHHNELAFNPLHVSCKEIFWCL